MIWIHTTTGEKVQKEDEQSHFRKLVENINWLAMNIKPDLCLDAIEMARNFEKARFKDIKKAGRIQLSNPGDSKEAILMVCAGGNYGKLNKEDNYERKVIALVGEGGRIYPIPWKNGKFPRPVRPALAAEAQAATNIMGEEMSGIDEGTIGLGLATDSKSLQEACHVDNQPKDKRTAVDTAVLKRSVDMNIYISSQKISRYEPPQYWVETKKISDSRPSNEARNIYKQGTSTSVPRRSVDMSIHSIAWRPVRSQTVDPLTKQGACRDR